MEIDLRFPDFMETDSEIQIFPGSESEVSRFFIAGDVKFLDFIARH